MDIAVLELGGTGGMSPADSTTSQVNSAAITQA